MIKHIVYLNEHNTEWQEFLSVVTFNNDLVHAQHNGYCRSCGTHELYIYGLYMWCSNVLPVIVTGAMTHDATL